MTDQEPRARLLDFTEDARQSLQSGFRLGRHLDVDKLGSLRILYGILEGRSLQDYLQDKGVNSELLRADIELQPETYILYRDNVIVPPNLSIMTIIDHLTPSGMRVLQHASRLSQRGSLDSISVRGLFVGVVLADAGETQPLFRKHGITTERMFE